MNKKSIYVYIYIYLSSYLYIRICIHIYIYIYIMFSFYSFKHTSINLYICIGNLVFASEQEYTEGLMRTLILQLLLFPDV